MPQKIKWEQFRRRTTPVLFPIAYYFRPYTLPSAKFPPVSLIAQLSYCDHDRQTLMEKRSFDRLQRWLVRRLLRTPGLMSRQVERSRRYGKHWLDWCRRSLPPERLHRASTADLARLYRQYQRHYEHYSLVNVFYWVFAGDRLIEELDRRLRRFIPDRFVRQEAVIHLTTPDVPSFLQAEERAMLRLALPSTRLTRHQLILALANHSKRFGWIPWDYVGPTYWTAEVIRRRLALLTRRGRIEKQLTAIRHHIQNVRRIRQTTERRWKLPLAIRQLAAATRAQAVLQDDKKAVTTETHYFLHLLQREVGRRLRVQWLRLYFASFDEIVRALNGGSLPDLAKRSRHGIIFMERGQLHPVVGSTAERWFRRMWKKFESSGSTIHGTVASPGMAKGSVKIVLVPKDVAKVRDGDILVTQMTTPEYVPAMKRAAAFVTDEGGITSHAAIVSRELNIPCIIGTKAATKVFKDGDRVEVDATKGIVRKV